VDAVDGCLGGYSVEGSVAAHGLIVEKRREGREKGER
jgi:hypothetical protein